MEPHKEALGLPSQHTRVTDTSRVPCVWLPLLSTMMGEVPYCVCWQLSIFMVELSPVVWVPLFASLFLLMGV